MEGERILKELKTVDTSSGGGEEADILLKRATDHLAPLFQEDHLPCDNATLAKLEVFSLKLLKLSLEKAKTSSQTTNKPTGKSSLFVDLCRLAVSALEMCSGSSRGKLPPLSFEKLLLHFLQLCTARREFGDVLNTCRTLRSRLAGEGEEEKEREEGNVILKHAFDLTWKAAASVEQVAQTKFENADTSNVVEVAELCLGLREEAFLCLLTVRETNARFAAERIVRSSQRYQKIMAGVCGSKEEYFERLLSFHTCLLALRDLPTLLLQSPAPSGDVFTGVDYLCHLSRVAHSAGHTHQSEEYLSRAEGVIVCDRKPGGDKEDIARKQRETPEQETLNSQLRALIHLTSVLTTFEMMTGASGGADMEETKLCGSLQNAVREMEKVAEGSCSDSTQLQRLWDTVELVFYLLHQRCVVMRERGGDPCSLLPRGVFPSLASLVISQVKVGKRRKGDGDKINRGKETQWLRKTSFLVDCMRESGHHGDVMETLVSVARGLPGDVLCEDGEGVEVMVGMWVRGKRELETMRPDSPSLDRWRDRTFLSLIPPSIPPLSTRVKSHILTSEQLRLTSSSGGKPTNQSAVAVGYELIQVYKEGGREWDVERGRVLVDMATTDSSLLDDGIQLIEGVVSGLDHTHPPPRRQEAHLHLASALVLKAVSVLQDRMGSCDVGGGSHDQEKWACPEPQQGSGEGGEVEECLSRAVGRWCDWGGGEEDREGGEVARVLYFLRLTAELCHLTCQFSLAGRCLWVLDKIHLYHPVALSSLPAAFQLALSAACRLQTSGGLARHDSCREDMCERISEAVEGEAGEGRGSELTVSYLSCRLTLASLHLEQREFDKCRSELVELFRNPFLSRHSVSAHTLTAGTKLTAARLLLACHAPLLPLRPFISHLIGEETGEGARHEGGGEGWRVTPLELVSSAVKTLSSVLQHLASPGSKVREGEEVTVIWGVLSRLLHSLLTLSRLHIQQGALREALYYAREGESLTHMMRLSAWHRKFVGVTTDIHTTRGDTKTIQTSATSFLVPPPSLLSPPHSLTNDSDNFTSSLEQAESLIQQGNPSDALTLCRELIQRYSENPDYDVVLAWAHLIAGRAILEEVALSRPVLLEELWGEAVSVSVQQRRRRGRGGGRRGAKGVGWLALIPEPFQEALDHFCTSLQLCHPSCPPQPLREVYRWLSVVLSPYHPSLASHCLLSSSHLSLAHRATSALGKKIRNQSQHNPNPDPFQDVLITLQDDPEGCPEITDDPLVSARGILQPPVSPPPLSHTLSLLSSLPDGCQFTVISLAPSLASQSEQEHLLLCVVGKNREPLFVKSLIESRESLARFSSMLAESDDSMKLSEKRKWWSIRRKLDRQMKEFVSELQSEWLGDHVEIFGSPPPTPGGTTGYHLLCIGRLVQHLPWEAIPVLQDQSVGRVPSLSFALAHQILQRANNGCELDPGLGYYVLNPRGDLPDTEKRFHGWFEKELRWRGVVGHAPSSTQFSEALQNHDVFVYCGHGTGREFLSTDHFQLLSCQATTLLMGCGSGRLVVGGACDPAGMALNYLLAGCPSLVAILWDVTDGDIDRLSKSLLEQWLEGGEKEEEEGEGVPLSLALARARSVCKLEGLNGYAAILYGNPSIAVT